MASVDSTRLFRLDGRTALVTGASRGLGKAMARALAGAGANLVISSRSATDLEAALPEILAGTDAEGAWVAADIGDRDEVRRLATEATAAFGAIDVLISNAGGNTPEQLEEVTDEAWDSVIEVHLGAAMGLTRALAPAMKARGWGRIVYVSSILATFGRPGRGAYSSVKAALRGLAATAAVELGPYGITVNTIAPGSFHTGALDRLTPEQRLAAREKAVLGRGGEPEELAGPVLLLAGDAGSFISGTTLVVDGGWLVKQ